MDGALNRPLAHLFGSLYEAVNSWLFRFGGELLTLFPRLKALLTAHQQPNELSVALSSKGNLETHPADRRSFISQRFSSKFLPMLRIARTLPRTLRPCFTRAAW